MRRTAILCLSIIISCTLNGQVFSCRTFSEEKGLEQKFIFSIAQDSNGVLLLGTESGIITYNGDYFGNAVSPLDLAEKQVATVISDSRGNTWAGHFQSGISCVKQGVVSFVDSSQSVCGRINSLSEDTEGNIWGISDGHGLFRVDNFTKKVSMPTGGELSTGKVIWNDKRLFVGCESGLRVYTIDDDQSVTLKNVLPETQGKNITSLCVGKLYNKEILFAAAEGDGIYCYNVDGGTCEFSGKLGSELKMNTFYVSSLSCDNRNILWIGTMGDGICKIVFSPALIPLRSEMLNTTGGLTDNNIQSLLMDDESNLWIGTFGSGLAQIPYSIFRYYTTANVLIKPEVNCLVKDEMRNAWIGTNTGVTCCAFASTPVQSTHYDAQNGFVNEKVTCMTCDTAGNVWIGTAGAGIYRVNPLDKKFRSISEKFDLSSRIINSMVVNDGQIYVGTSDGVYIFSNTESPPEYFTTMDGLAHNNVRHLYADRAQNVWFSSEGSPPSLMHGRQIRLMNEVDRVKAYVINGVCEDASGTHWIATDGEGLLSRTASLSGTVLFNNYGTESGMKSDHCNAVITEDNGNVWVVHNSGVSMKFPGDSIFYSFSGMDNKLFETMNSSVYKDEDGTIYFCSQNGLIEVTNEPKEYLRRDPHISLSRLFINGSERFISDKIELTPGSYNISFEFNTILLGSNTLAPFYYRIIGADTIWRSSNGRTIVIPQLSSGDYQLQVAASKHAIRSGEHQLGINITIDYPFWQKTWFTIAMILLVPIIVYGIIRLRTLSLVKLNTRLNVLVKEKTFLLEAEKESVAVMNTELQAKSKDITDSIKYAKRIQMAILPDELILKKNFPSSFIYYRPRDIVSGDFYWFAERDDLFFIAVVDCTGHGVPGAFMSMISSTLINKVVFDHGIIRPSLILAGLNSEIKASLHQYESSESSHDGMDIALCVVDRAKQVLYFSGAGRPLLHLSNGAVNLHKTNRGGLGGVYSKTVTVFEEIKIDIKKGDSFYMFTDGYADQFGGVNQRKFSSPKLRGLIKMISAHTMDEQGGQILEAFEAWKGDEEQCDDVLVVGFKVD